MSTPFFSGGNFGLQFNFGDTSGTSLTASTIAECVMLILVITTADGTNQPADMSVASVTGAGLTFQRYHTSSVTGFDYTQSTFTPPDYYNGTGTMVIEVWWAPAPSVITSQTYTVTMTDAVVRGGFCGQPVYGCNDISSPWVANSSLPFVFNIAEGDYTLSPVSTPANCLMMTFTGQVLDPVGPSPPFPSSPDAFLEFTPSATSSGNAGVLQSGTQDPGFAPSFFGSILGWDETDGVTDAVLDQTTDENPPTNASVLVLAALAGFLPAATGDITETGAAVDTTNQSHAVLVGKATETGTAVDATGDAGSHFLSRIIETGSAVDTISETETAPSSMFGMGTLRVIELTAAIPPEEYFVPPPFAKDYAMVWMGGFALAPDFNYEIQVGNVSWDAWEWDSNPYDLSVFTGILNIFNPINGVIVVTSATAQAAREQVSWKVVTDTPAFLRMPPALHDGAQLRGMATHNPTISYPLYNIRYEYLAQSPYFAGTLINPLAPTDTTITIQLFLKTLSWKLQDPNPLFNPLSRSEFETYPQSHTAIAPYVPGVIWINGERIEYYKLTRSGSPPPGAPSDYPGDMVVLSGLRRGTRGTTIAEQRTVSTGLGAGVPQEFTLNTVNGVGTLEVTVNGLPYTDYTTDNPGPNILGVHLTVPLDEYITVAMTNGFTYPADTLVYNGVNRFFNAVPVGIAGGDREIAPLNQLTGN